MKKIRLWKRDYDIIENLKRWFFTTSQLAKLYFPSLKKASGRLKSLFAAGHANRFQAPLADAKGRPEYIYCGTKAKIPKNYNHITHNIAITDFYVWLTEKAKKVKDIIVSFYFGSVLENQELLGGRLIPDAFFTIEKGDKKLLYFVEIDLGTETLRTSTNYSLEGKLEMYSELFDSGEYNKLLNHKFMGFRLLCIFNSHKRMQNLLGIAKEKNDDFLLCSTFEMLKDSEFLGKAWTDIMAQKVSLSGQK